MVAAAGVGFVLRSSHEHDHQHEALWHDHEHGHDDGHHEHAHDDLAASVVHQHRHHPDDLVHAIRTCRTSTTGSPMDAHMQLTSERSAAALEMLDPAEIIVCAHPKALLTHALAMNRVAGATVTVLMDHLDGFFRTVIAA